MGKALVIKGADFSKVAVTKELLKTLVYSSGVTKITREVYYGTEDGITYRMAVYNDVDLSGQKVNGVSIITNRNGTTPGTYNITVYKFNSISKSVSVLTTGTYDIEMKKGGLPFDISFEEVELAENEYIAVGIDVSTVEKMGFSIGLPMGDDSDGGTCKRVMYNKSNSSYYIQNVPVKAAFNLYYIK